MRIPIDNSTLGYIEKYYFSKSTDYVVFKPIHSTYNGTREIITFGQFKQNYKSETTYAYVENKEFWNDFRKSTKDFKFKVPTE